jgi:hypothetical protein
MARLIQHGQDRHAPPGGQLLRYADGRPITPRRYDHLWVRIGRQLPWVRTQQISTDWIRHTTLTWVEPNFGYAVARAYAGQGQVGRQGRQRMAMCRSRARPHHGRYPAHLPLADAEESSDVTFADREARSH